MILLGLIVAAIALVLAIVYGGDRLIIFLAHKDSLWSPFRLKAPEGQYYMIVRGSSEGPFSQLIESVPGWRFNKKKKTFVADPTSTSNDEGGHLTDELGVVWVGFFKKIYIRKRQYETYEKKKDSTERGLVTKVRDTHLFFFQTLLAAKVKGAETKEKTSVNKVVVFMMRVLRPVDAEFLAGKPEEMAINAVLAADRKYDAKKSYEEILRDEGQNGSSEFIEAILEVNNKGEDIGAPELSPTQGGLRKRFGIEVYSPYYIEVELSEDDKKFLDATKLKAIRKEEKDAALVEAEIIDINAKAEEDRIKRTYGAKTSVPGGEIIALAEAIEKQTTATTLVIGNSNIAIPTS